MEKRQQTNTTMSQNNISDLQKKIDALELEVLRLQGEAYLLQHNSEQIFASLKHLKENFIESHFNDKDET